MNILPLLLIEEGAYWPPTISDKFGQTSYGTPIQIRCKSTSARRESISKEGKTLNITGTVLTDTEVIEGGWIWVGTFADVPATPPTKQQIQNVTKTNDTENTETLYTASY